MPVIQKQEMGLPDVLPEGPYVYITSVYSLSL